MTDLKENKVPPTMRLLFFVIGLIGSVILIVYSLRWEDIPLNLYFFGIDITRIGIAVMLVFLGISFHSLLKSGILGKYKMD